MTRVMHYPSLKFEKDFMDGKDQVYIRQNVGRSGDVGVLQFGWKDYKGGAERWRKKNPKYGLARRLANRLHTIYSLGGRCVGCGEKDWRVLQVNHLRGKRGLKDVGDRLAGDIVKGRRDLADFDLRCANCNILYEHEKGRVMAYDL